MPHQPTPLLIVQLDPLGSFSTPQDLILRFEIGHLLGQFLASERRKQCQQRVNDGCHLSCESLANPGKIEVARFLYPADNCGQSCPSSFPIWLFHPPLMIIGIDPTVDFACKRVLGSPEHPAITLHFLNAVMRLPAPIREVRILNPTIEKAFEDDKWSLLDVLATDELGRLYDIEVQTTRPLGLRQRLAYYASSLLVGQLESGGDYRDLRPSICICLLDAIEFRSEPALHHNFQMRSESGLLLTDCLQVHLFELPKYVPPSDNRVINDPIEQWLYFFRRAEESTAEELIARLPDPVFAEAAGVLEMIARNPDERRLYNDRLKLERDERARNLQAREEGFQLGAAVERVQLLRELNGEDRGSAEDLAALGTAHLAALADDLQRRLRERR